MTDKEEFILTEEEKQIIIKYRETVEKAFKIQEEQTSDISNYYIASKFDVIFF